MQASSRAEAQSALLARAAGGDARAAQSLAGELGPALFAVGYRMLGDRAEAEDVAQEALLRLWRMAPRWDAAGGASVQTWVIKVARNLCIDRMRRDRRGPSLDEIAAPADPAPGAEARMLSAARMQALQDALRALPDRQRQAVVLRHIEGLGNPEIAEATGSSVEAVESLIARGKRALKAALGSRKSELGFEDDG